MSSTKNTENNHDLPTSKTRHEVIQDMVREGKDTTTVLPYNYDDKDTHHMTNSMNDTPNTSTQYKVGDKVQVGQTAHTKITGAKGVITKIDYETNWVTIDVEIDGEGNKPKSESDLSTRISKLLPYDYEPPTCTIHENYTGSWVVHGGPVSPTDYWIFDTLEDAKKFTYKEGWKVTEVSEYVPKTIEVPVPRIGTRVEVTGDDAFQGYTGRVKEINENGWHTTAKVDTGTHDYIICFVSDLTPIAEDATMSSMNETPTPSTHSTHADCTCSEEGTWGDGACVTCEDAIDSENDESTESSEKGNIGESSEKGNIGESSEKGQAPSCVCGSENVEMGNFARLGFRPLTPPTHPFDGLTTDQVLLITERLDKLTDNLYDTVDQAIKDFMMGARTVLHDS